MDCIQTRLVMVLQGRDSQELDADARAALEQHLEQCADCVAWSSRETRVDDALGQAIQAVPVPEALPSKILHQLEARRPARRAPWIAAAAAVLLMALGTSSYFWFNQRPIVGIAQIVDDGGFVAHKSPEAVEAWFQDQGLTMVAPLQFNYDLLNSCVAHTLKGRKVPRLEFFVRGDAQAVSAVLHVFVVADERFDVQELVASVQSPMPTHNHLVELRRFDNTPGFLFIAVYTSGNLDPFLAPQFN